MNENNLIETARQKAKDGDLQTAKAILEALDSERAKNLLNKVNDAIVAKKQEALASRANAPEKLKNKAVIPTEPNGNFALALLALVLICGVCWIIYSNTIPQQPLESIIEVCMWQEMAAPSTTCTPERIMQNYRPMVDACYDVWGSANVYNIAEWSNCLENKSVDLID